MNCMWTGKSRPEPSVVGAARGEKTYNRHRCFFRGAGDNTRFSGDHVNQTGNKA